MLESKRSKTKTNSALACYSLSDHLLGSQMLKIADQSMDQLPARCGSIFSETEFSQISFFFADLCPEVAFRLFRRSGTELARRRDISLAAMSDADLRRTFSEAFTSKAFQKLGSSIANLAGPSDDIEAIDLAAESAVNGNILVIAMDRIAAPDEGDGIAPMINVAAGLRKVRGSNGMWRPAIARKFSRDTSSIKSIDEILNGYGKAPFTHVQLLDIAV